MSSGSARRHKGVIRGSLSAAIGLIVAMAGFALPASAADGPTVTFSDSDGKVSFTITQAGSFDYEVTVLDNGVTVDGFVDFGTDSTDDSIDAAIGQVVKVRVWPGDAEYPDVFTHTATGAAGPTPSPSPTPSQEPSASPTPTPSPSETTPAVVPPVVSKPAPTTPPAGVPAGTDVKSAQVPAPETGADLSTSDVRQTAIMWLVAALVIGSTLVVARKTRATSTSN